MAVALLNASYPPANPAWHREETDDDDGSFNFESLYDSKEADDDYDSSKIVAVDREEADDDDGYDSKEADDDYEIVDKEEDDDDYEIVRCGGDVVCRGPHHSNWFGGALWDVISIKIRRNMKYHESEVSIHGAIRVHTNDHFTDYLFKRRKEDAQVFKDPGEVLTLSLVGPHKPWVLKGFSSLPGLNLYAFLKYNNHDIFGVSPNRPPEFYTSLLKGCPPEFCADNGYWGDFKGCSDLFSEKDHPVGYGRICVPYISSTCLYTKKFCFRGPILDEVTSVEVELAQICPGLVACLEVISSRDLDLYGEITARSCLFENGVVLFHTTKEKPMTVKSNMSIPLSRRMTSVDCGAYLLIKVHVQDAKDPNFLVDETIQFNPSPEKGYVPQKTTSNSVFSVKVKWTFDLYDGPNFSFPDDGW